MATQSISLTNVCDICDLENIVTCPTCFTKGADPTLIDVILVQIKGNTPSLRNRYKTYRSYKQFNYEAFIQDLDNTKLDEQIINDDNKDIHKT